MPKELTTLGLDFGTSNTSASYVDSDGRIVHIKLQNQGLTQPSAIFLRHDRYHSTGPQAVSDFLSANPIFDSYHFVPSIKPGLPSADYEGISLRPKRSNNGNGPVTFFEVPEIASFLLQDVKDHADRQTNLSGRFLVLGRPVKFSEDSVCDQLAQSRLEEAAKMVGFDNIIFVPEPIAAAINYQHHTDTKGKTALIFDFGGGTLDTCIIEFPRGGSPSEDGHRVLSSHGILLGGNDIDKDIFRRLLSEYFGSEVTFGPRATYVPYHIHQQLLDWHLQELNNSHVLDGLRQIRSDSNCTDKEAIERLILLISKQRVPSILGSIEKAKIDVTETGVGQIEYGSPEFSISRPLSRTAIKDSAHDRVKQIQGCIDETLRLASLDTSDIEVVVRVGGSSRLSFVREILQSNFGDAVEDNTDLTSVSAGLGLVASRYN